jgi:hypothetical protein
LRNRDGAQTQTANANRDEGDENTRSGCHRVIGLARRAARAVKEFEYSNPRFWHHVVVRDDKGSETMWGHRGRRPERPDA